MKYALTVLASLIVALLATWYAIAARVQMLARAPEQATVLVVPGPDGACVPRVARPVIKAHTDDTIEWRAVELPGCEGQGAFALEAAAPDQVDLFAPALRLKAAREQTVRVRHQATANVTASYRVVLANGKDDTARIVFF